MLIDDESIDNFVNEKIIKAYAFAKNVLIHTSAKSGLEFLNNLAVMGYPASLIPDFIFLDLNMPMIDGFQFLDLLQESELPKKNVKVIVLTASLNPTDQQKATKYKQVVGFFQKPLSEETLLKLNNGKD